MNVLRVRFGSTFDWVIAAAFLIATLVVASLIVRELRAVSAVQAGVSAGAVAVPVLLLPDGREIRVGDSAARVATVLGRNAEIGTQVVDRGRFGERLTRFYEHARTRFALAFEAGAADGELRVSAIYLQ